MRLISFYSFNVRLNYGGPLDEVAEDEICGHGYVNAQTIIAV